MTAPPPSDEGERLSPVEVANGRARWVLALTLPLLVTVLIAGVGWTIHQHDLLNATDAVCRETNAAQEARLATLNARQEENLRRVGVVEQHLRDLELAVAVLSADLKRAR